MVKVITECVNLLARLARAIRSLLFEAKGLEGDEGVVRGREKWVYSGFKVIG